jgi:hypothetical protein
MRQVKMANENEMAELGDGERRQNIAVLIGINTYKNLHQLPACVGDVLKMKDLLKATGRFHSIEVIHGEHTADQVKDKIRNFFATARAIKIGEVFFYFSGHGTVEKDDVLFCCSDFNEKTPSTTSLTNSEVDDLIRSVSPSLAVKVLDACNSGAPYVKDAADGFQKSLSSSKGKIEKFYCMASSQLDQLSYAEADASDFTRSFVQGALRRDAGSVLYRDIHAFIADSFSGNKLQTPFFIFQGSGTEEFATVNAQMLELRNNKQSSDGDQENGDSNDETLIDEISAKDALYVSEDNVRAALEKTAYSLERAEIQDSVVSKYYSTEISWVGKVENLDDNRSLAKWAFKEGLEKRFLIKILAETYFENVANYGSLTSYLGMGKSIGDIPTKKVRRSRPSKLLVTHDLPIEAIHFDFKSIKHPSLRTFRLRIALFHSRTEVMVLTSMGLMKEVGWSTEKLETADLKWTVENLLWRDVVLDGEKIWRPGLEKATAAVREYIETFGSKEKEKH